MTILPDCACGTCAFEELAFQFPTRIVLDEASSRAFAAAMARPPEPSPALVALFRRLGPPDPDAT